MKNGKPNPLNFEADKRPGDPTAVSDPKCWITGRNAELIQEGLISGIRAIQYAPRYSPSGVLDISDNIEIGTDGRLRSKDDADHEKSDLAESESTPDHSRSK